MNVQVTHIHIPEVTIYYADFGDQSLSAEDQIALLDELHDLLLNDNGLCSVVLNLGGVKPIPNAKAHSKKLIDLMMSKPKYVGSVMLNADVFMKMIIKLVETKLDFSDGLGLAPRKTFFAKTINEAQDLIVELSSNLEASAV